MKLIANLSIRKKLALLVLPPLLVAMFDSFFVIADYRATASNNQIVVTLANLAAQNSALVHELQKERGLTAGFLGGDGSKFEDKLATQREAVNKRLNQWRTYLSAHEDTITQPSVQNDIQKVRQQLQALATTRRNVSSRNIQLSTALGYYTQMNAKLLAIAPTIAKESESAESARIILNYDQFLQAKERAGIERAVLSNVFSRDSFTPALYKKFITLVANQDSYLASFISTSDSIALDIFTQHKQHPSFAQVTNYREVATSNSSAGGFGVDAAEWFSTATARINELKAIEDKLSRHMIDHAQQELSSASQSIWSAVIFALGTLGVVYLLAAHTGNLLLKQTASLRKCILTVSDNNDLTARAEVLGDDELGSVARRLNAMLDVQVELIATMNTASEELASVSTEIATTIEQSHRNVLDQKDQTNQLVVAINELNATAQEVARNTQHTASAAGDANESANSSDRVVSEAVE